MLKDLDQRNAEQQNSSTVTVPVQRSKSPRNGILIGLIIIVVLNILGLFVWQLYVENQNYQQQQQKQQAQKESADKKQFALPNNSLPQQPNKVIKGENNHSAESITTSLASVSMDRNEENAHDQVNNALLKEDVKSKVTAQINTIEQDATTQNILEEQPSKTMEVDKNKLSNKTTDSAEKPVDTLVKASEAAHPQIKLEESATSMSVSRRQLSPETLAQQKMNAAEQAIENKDITLAEQYLEDILIILPSHQGARKQLAALWFGREAYQAALNVLSQGIKLSPSNSEFRLMQARIYLQQNNAAHAYQILQVLKQTADIEYQTTLANIAQQLGHYPAAINAYQILSNLQVKQGRWAMGLAIAYDSNSQFKQAAEAYQLALSLESLSESARAFIKERLQALGE
jgi:MSHA biogenesis protein MshN